MPGCKHHSPHIHRPHGLQLSHEVPQCPELWWGQCIVSVLREVALLGYAMCRYADVYAPQPPLPSPVACQTCPPHGLQVSHECHSVFTTKGPLYSACPQGSSTVGICSVHLMGSGVEVQADMPTCMHHSPLSLLQLLPRHVPPYALTMACWNACGSTQGVARVGAGRGEGSLVMSRLWLNPGATSAASECCPAHIRGWLAAPHEIQAHGRPVSSGVGSETAPHEIQARGRPVSSGAGSETHKRGWLEAHGSIAGTRSWLQPKASPAPEHMRSWMEPSATAEPQPKRQRMDGSNGSHRSWLALAKSAEPQPKRSESGVPSPEPAERH